MKKNGQAVVEFVVALIPLLVLVAGLVQFGLLASAHTRAMGEAREEAAQHMLAPLIGGPATEYYEEWTDGDDDASYSADDESHVGNLLALSSAIVNPAHPIQLQEQIGDNLISALPAAPYLIFWGLQQGKHTETVPVLPIVRSLFYAGEEIEVSVSKAPGDKCERCWTYSPSVGLHSEIPTLCSRCFEILKEIDKGRG